MKYQITFFADKYKPLSQIVECEVSPRTSTKALHETIAKARLKVCVKKRWSLEEFRSYGYSTYKIRLAPTE